MQYKFKGVNGGLRSFSGVLHSAKDITRAVRDLSVEKNGKGKVTITYKDGCVYTMECDRTQTDSEIALENIVDKWYNGMETVVLMEDGGHA